MNEYTNNNYFCPRCLSSLVFKKTPRSEFLGCSNYPECLFTTNSTDASIHAYTASEVINIKDSDKFNNFKFNRAEILHRKRIAKKQIEAPIEKTSNFKLEENSNLNIENQKLKQKIIALEEELNLLKTKKKQVIGFDLE